MINHYLGDLKHLKFGVLNESQQVSTAKRLDKCNPPRLVDQWLSTLTIQTRYIYPDLSACYACYPTISPYLTAGYTAMSPSSRGCWAHLASAVELILVLVQSAEVDSARINDKEMISGG